MPARTLMNTRDSSGEEYARANALRVEKGLKLLDLNDDNILLFRNSKKRDDKWQTSILQQYSAKVADVFEASKRQRNTILAFYCYDMEELVNIKS